MSIDTWRTESGDSLDANLAAASKRYWASQPAVRELVIRAFEAHVAGLALKYGANTINDLWTQTASRIAIYDSVPTDECVEMQDAIQAYWIAHIYPGGVLAYGVFGMGIFKESAVDWILEASDEQLLAISPKPWLNGPILVDICADDVWSKASLSRRKEAVGGLIQLGKLVRASESGS